MYLCCSSVSFLHVKDTVQDNNSKQQQFVLGPLWSSMSDLRLESKLPVQGFYQKQQDDIRDPKARKAARSTILRPISSLQNQMHTRTDICPYLAFLVVFYKSMSLSNHHFDVIGAKSSCAVLRCFWGIIIGFNRPDVGALPGF